MSHVVWLSLMCYMVVSCVINEDNQASGPYDYVSNLVFYIASAYLRICIHWLIYNWLCFCVDCSIDKVVSMVFIA